MLSQFPSTCANLSQFSKPSTSSTFFLTLFSAIPGNSALMIVLFPLSSSKLLVALRVYFILQTSIPHILSYCMSFFCETVKSSKLETSSNF